MKTRRGFLTILAVAGLLGATYVAAVRGADVLYVGDGDDTVKRFDAATGAPLDAPGRPFVGGLRGPRTLLVADGRLPVANQNVDLRIPGEFLARDAPTGTPLGVLVSSAPRKDAPFVPWGILVWRGPENDRAVGMVEVLWPCNRYIDRLSWPTCRLSP